MSKAELPSSSGSSRLALRFCDVGLFEIELFPLPNMLLDSRDEAIDVKFFDFGPLEQCFGSRWPKVVRYMFSYGV